MNGSIELQVISKIIASPNDEALLDELCSFDESYYALNAFISLLEPKNINKALKDEDWVIAMQEELVEFERN